MDKLLNSFLTGRRIGGNEMVIAENRARRGTRIEEVEEADPAEDEDDKEVEEEESSSESESESDDSEDERRRPRRKRH